MKHKFDSLIEVVQKVRNECPWDKIQTINTVRQFILEEAYEVVDAINENDYNKLKEELGDLLLQILFISIITNQKKKFGIYQVIEHVQEKLITRHPHIFGNKKLKKPNEVLRNWEKMKNKNSIFEAIPETMPALLRALRIQQKAVSFGKKIKNKLKINFHNEKELGEVLFYIVDKARKLNLNPEEALKKVLKNFIISQSKI